MYSFDLKKKQLIDDLRSEDVYTFNLAQNLALLSNDVSTIRRFFQVQIPQYYKDTWLAMSGKDMFMGYYQQGQAFVYYGIIPMIVQGKVNLVASNGFTFKSDDKDVDDALNKVKEECNLQKFFEKGVYWESGIGDFAYRISVDKSISDLPIIDLIEPQNLEIKYSRGKVKSFIIKELSKDDINYERHEIHFKNEAGFVCIAYRYKVDGNYVSPDDEYAIKECEQKFGGAKTPAMVTLPFKDFLIVYKQNSNNNQLYKGERGVPDIQGLVAIEDALCESISDLVDAIRKGGIKTYVSDELIPQDINGNDMRLNQFNKTIITTKGGASNVANEDLFKVTQGNIQWESYVRAIQNLMSVAINKAGLAPTTLGLTGLESINSSAESQDAREKTSMRTRDICLKAWSYTLKELMNKYLQVRDYIKELPLFDYSDMINVTFNEYTNPTLENITNVLAKQVQTGLKSQMTAIKELNEGMSEEQAEDEFMQIMAENGANIPELPDGEVSQVQGRPQSKITVLPFN